MRAGGARGLPPRPQRYLRRQGRQRGVRTTLQVRLVLSHWRARSSPGTYYPLALSAKLGSRLSGTEGMRFKVWVRSHLPLPKPGWCGAISSLLAFRKPARKGCGVVRHSYHTRYTYHKFLFLFCCCILFSVICTARFPFFPHVQPQPLFPVFRFRCVAFPRRQFPYGIKPTPYRRRHGDRVAPPHGAP